MTNAHTLRTLLTILACAPPAQAMTVFECCKAWQPFVVLDTVPVDDPDIDTHR